MSDDVVTLQRRGHVAVITVTVPEQVTAMTTDVAQAERVIDTLISEHELRVGVLMVVGKSFDAGRSMIDDSHLLRAFDRLVTGYVDKPLIAAVSGSACGGGTELMMACDLAVMSEDTTLGLPDVKRGTISGGGGLIRLPRKVPRAIALEYAMTGRPMDAQTARRWGLVNQVVPQAEILDAAVTLADEIAQNAPCAVAATKCIVHRSSEFGSDWLPAVWSFSDALTSAVMDTDDAKNAAGGALQTPLRRAGH